MTARAHLLSHVITSFALCCLFLYVALLACMEGLDEAALGMLARADVNTWPPAATVYNQVVDSSEAQTPLR
eukprot:COSAG02_NODE_40114_length_409_cov_0.709677_1_plen_70_part_01